MKDDGVGKEGRQWKTDFSFFILFLTCMHPMLHEQFVVGSHIGRKRPERYHKNR